LLIADFAGRAIFAAVGGIAGDAGVTAAAEALLIEATAFGALTIIKRMEEHGVEVREVVNTGGLSLKNETLMQIYADVIGLPMKVAASEQTCAMGSALFGAVASGQTTLTEAQAASCKMQDRVYTPNPENQEMYASIYQLYREIHDAFGTSEWQGKLDHVMKQLIDLRQQARTGK
jgi:L-ribulokinase